MYTTLDIDEGLKQVADELRGYLTVGRKWQVEASAKHTALTNFASSMTALSTAILALPASDLNDDRKARRLELVSAFQALETAFATVDTALAAIALFDPK